jgi:creatinine amidohydrolase
MKRTAPARSSRPTAMRTRIFESLSTYEITAYLKRNDVVYLPVGTVEMHGQMPVGVEHIMPLAIALRMAEQTDGLVMSGLQYFYPGATLVGDGTIGVTPTLGKAYLREICLSLLRQGFRRQVLLTAHGPAFVTVAPMVREFFEETRCPIAYLDLNRPISKVKADFDKMIWGSYSLLGRLEELQPQPHGRRNPDPPEQSTLGGEHMVNFGYYLCDVTQHGWWPKKRMTAAERQARAREGVRDIDRVLQAVGPTKMIAKLRKLDTYVQKKVLPKYGHRLP